MSAAPGIMKAYVMQARGRGAVVDMAVPEPGPGEVRIRAAYTGICGSDLHAYHGMHVRRPLPLVPGHETCGIVDAFGPGVEMLRAGARVVVHPERGCASCASCAQGQTNVCTSKMLLGTQRWPGGFAEYFCAPVDSVVELPANLDLRLAALVEPMAVAVHAVRQAGFAAGQSVLVFGSGGIGSILLRLCRILGCSRSIVCDVNSYKVEMAGRLGADTAIDTSTAKGRATLTREVAEAPDVAFIAASHHDLVNQSFDLVRPLGTIALVGQFNKPGVIDIDRGRIKEQTIVGSFTYTARDFRDAVALLARHQTAFAPLITRQVTLDQVDDTIKALCAGRMDALKIVAEMGVAQHC